MPIRPDDAVARHGPEESVQCTGLLAEKVPSRVVRRSRLWDLAVLHWFHSMYQVREQDGVLDEEYGDVIADDVLRAVSGAFNDSYAVLP